jgi:probable DNA repair protein
MHTLTQYPTVLASNLGANAAQDVSVLTVNNRLARRLIQLLAQQQSARGQLVTEIPEIMPWSGWVTHQLGRAGFEESLRPHARQLDGFEAQLVWAQVIERCEGDDALLDVHQAAAIALAADQLIEEWQIKVFEHEYTEEYDQFRRWRDAYRERLHALDALDASTALTRLIHHVESGLPVPAQVVLAGFTEISPRMGVLLDALVARGVEVSTLVEDFSQTSQVIRVEVATAQAEWQAAVAWARAQLDSQPSGRFAIVAVSLDAQAAFARRVLEQGLGDEEGVPVHAFNVAVARPLSDWGACRAAIAWLRTFVLMKEQLGAAPSDLGAALLSGHCVGHSAEQGVRAMVDAGWRDWQVSHVSLATWTSAIEPLHQLSPAWQRAWQDWQTLPRSMALHRWSSVFRASLATLGFPGRGAQSSAMYQVLEAIDALLERFESMSALFGSVQASEALSTLGRLARATMFQPQRDPTARLDVLGFLEAEGGQWDGIWMLGLTDEVLPAATKPNPLIPMAALRRAQAPRATPERESLWAQQIFSNLCKVAPAVNVSSPRFEGERALRASPLIQALAPIEAIYDPGLDSVSRWVPPFLDVWKDDQGPPLGANEKIQGGVSVLETQAINPLWAFFRYRLGVKGLPAYGELAQMALRGKFLHGVMERVWELLRDQSSLKEAIDGAMLLPQLQKVVNAVATKELGAYDTTLRELEIDRAIRVVHGWLLKEADRAPFVVQEIEQKRQLNLKGLVLDVRLDRLDQLVSEDQGDGTKHLAVIDYKTGRSLPSVLKDWESARPVNLQVPLYAAMLNAEGGAERDAGSRVSALMLVRLHARGSEALGLAEHDALGLSGLKTLSKVKYADADWSCLLARLSAVIDMLAQEFVQGKAVNQSWKGADLALCDILPLLRYFDQGEDELQEGSDDDS